MKPEIETELRSEAQVHPKPKGIAGFAIQNAHFIVVAALIVSILGGLSLMILPKDLLPPANMPAVQILSFYSGMPVEEVENSLSEGFERYTGQAVGIDHQESKSLVGVSIVRNFFNPETDLNTAIAQTTSLVMSALRRLPPGTMPPLILPFDPMAAVPLALVAVSGDYPEKVLYDTARYNVGNTIQAVPGGMAPTVMGGAERQILVYADPKKLREYNLSPLNVLDRITKFNTFIPSGDVKMDHFDYQILSNGIVDHVQEMNDFPIRTENGVPVYVKDIGHAQDAHKIQTNIVMVDGKRQVYVPVYRQPGANSIRVVDEVKKALAELESTLHGFKLRLVADQSSFIRHAIESITEEAVIGGGLAALMVLLFLGNPTATFGILLSLPLSLLCAFIGLKASGQTVNAMTLGGLALSIGVLVDNSIVVLENIIHKLGHAPSAREAALLGASEVGMPVLSATISTMVVFFPVVFLTGIVKILFGALAKAVLFAMLGSYFTAMTVIPLFSSKLLKKNKVQHELKGFFGLMHRLIHNLTHAYGKALALALRYRMAVLIVIVIVLAAGASLAGRIGTELFPRADAGNFMLELRQPTGTRIEETEKFAKSVEAKLREWIDKDDLAMIITNAGVYYGFPAAFTPNSGPQDVFFNVALTDERKHTSQYYAKIIREKLPREFPNAEMGIELGGLLTSALNGGARAPIDVQVQGPELEKSGELARKLAEQFKSIPGAVDVRVQQRFDAPAISLELDRKAAGELGITAEEVIKNVVSAVSGSSTFNPSIWVDPKTGIDYLLGVQFAEEAITRIDQLQRIPITGRNQERQIPLGKLARISMTKSPSEINHVNLKPVVDVFMDAQGRDIGGVSNDALKAIDQAGLPKGYHATIHGEISEMKSSVGSLGGGFLLAAILVYLILVVQFRSFLLPLIIMVTVPMGMVGIIVMLALTHTYFSIQAAIGAIFMIGIAVANGVLLIEFILHESRIAAEPDTGILNGAKARLRPIMMTSLASILGLVPMAIGFGHGSEANIPLGRAVIGGQLVSTTLTLFVVPILFRILYKQSRAEEVQS